MKTIINNIWDKIVTIYEIINSIQIVSNPTINLVIKIGVLLIGFLIIKGLLKSIFGKGPGTTSGYITQPDQYIRSEHNKKTIDECISEDDLNFQMTQAEEEILNAIQKNRREIKDTLRKANKTVDISWLDSCNKILRVSKTLDKNLAYYKHKNLEESKFQYYASLHFRSMIAADIAYSEYEKINDSFGEINNFIVRMKSRPEFRGSYKTEVYEEKDQIKLLRNLYLNHVHNMNHQTEELRDKIGIECGKKGKEWWLERTRHKN